MARPGDLIREAAAQELHPPYPAFQDAEVALLEVLLRLLWQEARSKEAVAKHGIAFDTAKEEEISFAIALTLELVQSTDSPMVSEFLEVFSIAPPEPKLDNFNRSSISKKCDFFFGRLHHQRGTRPNQNGMFVEAKLVSPKHPMGYYVSTGLQRFLNGDYAWAMPQAMLLGYCRATSQVLPDSLADHFARESGRKAQELAVIKGPTAFAKSRVKPRMHWSSHRRPQTLPSSGHPLGDICVYHLWLDIHA